MSAENKFREAFQRLKQNHPITVVKGTPISQNNVAREAGLDPSALKKARFQSLVDEIQQWFRDHENLQKSPPFKPAAAQRKINRGLKNTIKDLKLQRDQAIGLLLDADKLILKLTNENIKLRASTTTPTVRKIRDPNL